jgi:hypothetical protein
VAARCLQSSACIVARSFIVDHDCHWELGAIGQLYRERAMHSGRSGALPSVILFIKGVFKQQKPSSQPYFGDIVVCPLGLKKMWAFRKTDMLPTSI